MHFLLFRYLRDFDNIFRCNDRGISSRSNSTSSSEESPDEESIRILFLRRDILTSKLILTELRNNNRL